MSAEAAIAHTTINVGNGYTVTLTVPQIVDGATIYMTAEWSPDLPLHLTKKMMARYRRGRDQLLSEMSERTGLSIAVVEI